MSWPFDSRITEKEDRNDKTHSILKYKIGRIWETDKVERLSVIMVAMDTYKKLWWPVELRQKDYFPIKAIITRKKLEKEKISKASKPARNRKNQDPNIA